MSNYPKDDITPDNMGRCDLCGMTIDLEHKGHTLVAQGLNEMTPDHPEIDKNQVRQAILDALEHGGSTPYDAMMAQAIREKGEFVSHKSCFEQTTLHWEEGDDSAETEDV